MNLPDLEFIYTAQSGQFEWKLTVEPALYSPGQSCGYPEYSIFSDLLIGTMYILHLSH